MLRFRTAAVPEVVAGRRDAAGPMAKARRALRAVAFTVLLLVVALAGVGLAHRPNTVIPAGVAGTHAMVGGSPIRVVQKGSGRDVLLIHGSPGSVEDWTPLLDELAGSLRVTAYDRPGHGYSGDLGRYSHEDNADVALALIDSLGLRHVVVVGHSYGGTTALAMAVRTPATVDAVVVLDSATYTPSRKVDVALRIVGLPVLGMGVATVMGPLLAPRRIREGLLAEFAGTPPSEAFIDLRTTLWSTPKVTHAIAVETRDAAENLRRLSPRYSGIRRPVFIVAQADDEFRRTTAERLHQDVPGSTLELLHGTGHFVHLERTEAVVRVVRRAAGSEGASGAAR